MRTHSVVASSASLFLLCSLPFLLLLFSFPFPSPPLLVLCLCFVFLTLHSLLQYHPHTRRRGEERRKGREEERGEEKIKYQRARLQGGRLVDDPTSPCGVRDYYAYRGT